MESIYRAEDIKILQAEPRFRRLWNSTNQVSGDIGLKQRQLGGLLVNFAQAVQQLAYAGVVIAGVYGILDGSLSFGAVLACSILNQPHHRASRSDLRDPQPPAECACRQEGPRFSSRPFPSITIRKNTATTSLLWPGATAFENVVYAYEPEAKPALIIPGLAIEPR